MSKRKVAKAVEDLAAIGCIIEIDEDRQQDADGSYLDLSLWIHTEGWSFDSGDRSCSCYYDRCDGGAKAKWEAALDDLLTVSNVPVREHSESA